MQIGRVLCMSIFLFLILKVTCYLDLFNHKEYKESISCFSRIISRSTEDDYTVKYFSSMKPCLSSQSGRRQNHSPKYTRRRIPYYSNHIATFNLVLIISHGDIELNPGPVSLRSSRDITRKIPHSSNNSTVTQLSASSTHQTNNPVFNIGLQHSGLKICHLNIRSLFNKLTEVKLLLSSSKIDILVLTETWLDPSYTKECLRIPGYKIERKDRGDMDGGGGILFYINENLNFKEIDEVYSQENTLETLETLCINILFTKSRPITIVGIYRPPDALANYWTIFENYIDAIMSRNNETIVVGDLNVDLMKGSNSSRTCPLSSIMNCYGFVQLINEPTRIALTKHNDGTETVSKTLIDHIYVSNPENVAQVLVPKLTISDHYAVAITRKLKASAKSCKYKSHKYINYRNYKNFDPDRFVNNLKELSWSDIYDLQDPNDALQLFHKLLTDVLNKHAPVCQKRVREPTLNTPYLNTEITTLIKRRDALKDSFIKGRATKQEYNTLRNHVISKIKAARRVYYKSEIDKHCRDPKKLWRTFKSMLPTKSHESVLQLETSDGLTNNTEKICNIFNSFFTDAARRCITNNINATNCNLSTLSNYLQDKLSTSTSAFGIPDMTLEFVTAQIKKLSEDKATGHDGIPVRILKIALPVINKPILHIFNLSINTGTFPNSWKISKVTPLFKSGSHLDANNYRPIAVLPVLSKILERHVHFHLMVYLNGYDLIHSFQSGFRQKHSCEFALINMVDKWLEAISKGELSGALFIDFRKAFDLVDHKILIRKLKVYNLQGLALEWFKSYLIDRQQFVSIGSKSSTKLTITHGVPQGSILGPILFILFINDLPLSCNCNVNADLYADDTTISAFSKNVNEIRHNLQLTCNDISAWCKQNNMSLNTDKTKFMLISSAAKSRINTDEISITLNGSTVKQICHNKVLGVIIDHNLTWEHHIKFVCSKIHYRLRMINRIKEYLGLKHRLLLYNALVKPYFLYCSSVWANYNIFNFNKLFLLQKRAGKILLDRRRDASTVDIFNKLKWIPIFEEIKINRLSNVYKAIHNLTPDYISSSFNSFKSTHSYNTRNATNNNFILPRARSDAMKKTFKFSGAKDFNVINNSFKQCKSIKEFKKKLYGEVLNKQMLNKITFNTNRLY